MFHYPAQVHQIPGKVLFSSSAEIHNVCELKAAERLFLLLKLSTPEPLPTQANKGRGKSKYNYSSFFNMSETLSPSPHPPALKLAINISSLMFAAKAATVLQSRLLGEKDQWRDAVMTWRRLQRELERKKPAHSTSRRKTGHEEEEGDSQSEVVERRKISGGPNESKVQRVEEPSGPGLKLKKKRKRDDEEEEEERTIATQDYIHVKSVEKSKMPESRIGTGLDSVVSRREVNGVISSEEELITYLPSASNISTMDAVAEGDAGRNEIAGKHLPGFYFNVRLTFLQFLFITFVVISFHFM